MIGPFELKRSQKRQEQHLHSSNRATILAVTAATLCLLAGAATRAGAQKLPTATQPLHVSAFGGVTGVQTDLGQGKNLGVTAGVDLGLVPYRFIHPSLEVRGTIAIDKGHIDSQKNVLGGIKLGGDYHQYHPYVDVLFGRAQIQYPGKGTQVPNTFVFYTSSSSYALAGGGGLDVDVTRQISLKVDAQLERLSTPVLPGNIYPYTVTIGATYRFGGGWRRNKPGK